MADEHSWDFDIGFDCATVYASSRGVHVDLHWSLLSDPRFYWDESNGRTVWDRAVTMPFGDGTALALCPEDLLVYLSMHLAVHHGLTGLLWYWDLARLLERWQGKLDWETVVARASRWRVRGALYFALNGCDDLFGVSAPAAILGRLRPREPRAAALRWLLRHCDAARLKHLEHVSALLLVDRARGVIASLTHGVFPSHAWLRARYEKRGPLARRLLSGALAAHGEHRSRGSVRCRAGRDDHTPRAVKPEQGEIPGAVRLSRSGRHPSIKSAGFHDLGFGTTGARSIQHGQEV
jgi:hypothetical protein